MQQDIFEYGGTYHIYNRGINKEDIFKEERNYAYFLSLMKKYLAPVTDIYAYCLMKNHYHLLLRFKEQQNVSDTDAYIPLCNMLNAYSKSINKNYQRTGSLFQRHPKRNKVMDKEYFMQLVVYIHLNPVKHNFSSFLDYPHSSYRAIISDKPTDLDRKTVIDYFDDVDNLIGWHDFKRLEHEKIKELAEEDL